MSNNFKDMKYFLFLTNFRKSLSHILNEIK